MSEKILADRYRLVEQIGVGGMAIVYRAIDQRTGHNVAIKVLKPDYSHNAEYIGRFQREAEAASKMTHHNIVNLLDVGMDGENRYLVMEYVQGQTLKQVIQERGRLSPQTACRITIRILSALQHAHQNGIIHRDIKPQNILVHADGHVKVSDFGIARMADSSTLTTGDSVMGSVHYFSPEQARGQTADARSDIYSVGVCLYEMLTGRVPFDGESTVAIAMQQIQAQPVPIEKLAPDVPPAIRHVCMIAMEKNPKYRYQSAAEMAQELRMAVDGRTGQMQPRLVETVPQQPVPQQPASYPRPDTGRKKALAQTGRVRPPRKPWHLVMLALLTVTVFVGLYFGIMAIYDHVSNSATVPDMIGMEQSAAERAAVRAGLNASAVEVYSASVPAGSVIAQAPEANTELRKGDTVVLTVSRGVSSQVVPQVVGLTTGAAIEQLRSYGMTVTVTERVPSAEPADTILTQYPEAGTACQSGDMMQVTVSGGSAYVPNLNGKSLAESEDLLVSSGLAMNPNLSWEITSDASKHGLVAEQSPAAGLQVTEGTAVTLTLWRVPALAHTETITLDLPVIESTLTVRVTLSSDQEESVIYQATVTPETASPQVEIWAAQAGTYFYRVYVNDSFAYQKQITLE